MWFDRYEQKVYENWTKGVDAVCKTNLDQALITRDESTKLIKINFDPKVCMCMMLKLCQNNLTGE